MVNKKFSKQREFFVENGLIVGYSGHIARVL